MTEEELQKMNLETEHGIFTPMYSYESYDNETNSYVGFVLIKTAKEKYEEWLENKDKVIKPQQSVDERVISLEKQLADLEISQIL